MKRIDKQRKRFWPKFVPKRPFKQGRRRHKWIGSGLATLLLYALLKVIGAKPTFAGMWITAFLNAVEAIFMYISETLLSPVGLIVLAFIWLIRTGDLYQLLNKVRYMRLAKGDSPAIHYQVVPSLHEPSAKPLNALQRTLLGDMDRTSNVEQQQTKLSQLVIYQQLLKNPAALSLLQFLHYYRRDDITFYQVAQFLVSEGLLEKDQLSRQELEVEATVLGYMSYLEYSGMIKAHVTLQPSSDGFYGTIHKIKIPRHVQEVIDFFSE